jgi:dTDP-4-amino-4,6-dideoxygalactose transaminase
MFSFGPIKTSTALGGGVIRVRDPQLRAEMIELHRSYPTQGRLSYLKRLVKYSGMCVLGRPWVYELMIRLFAALGRDYDEVLNKAAHSFSGGDFFTQIRRRPCVPLMRLVAHRIHSFDRDGNARLARRIARGAAMVRSLPAGMVVGSQNPTHTFWVYPLRVANAAEVIDTTRRAGFDVSARSSLVVVRPDNGSAWEEAPPAAWLSDIVFLPSCDGMPDSEWQRLIAIIEQVAILPAPQPTAPRELAAAASVSRS